MRVMLFTSLARGCMHAYVILYMCVPVVLYMLDDEADPHMCKHHTSSCTHVEMEHHMIFIFHPQHEKDTSTPHMLTHMTCELIKQDVEMEKTTHIVHV